MNLGRIIKSLASIALLFALTAGIMLSSADRAYATEGETLTGYAWEKVGEAPDPAFGFFAIGDGKVIASSIHEMVSYLVDTQTQTRQNFGYFVISAQKISDGDFFFVEYDLNQGLGYIRRYTDGVISDRMISDVDFGGWMVLAGEGNDIYAFGSNKLMHFDLSTGTWSEIPIPLPTANLYIGQCTSSYLYLAYGAVSDNKAVLYRYDRTNHTWLDLSPNTSELIGLSGIPIISMWVSGDDSLISISFDSNYHKVYSYKNGQWAHDFDTHGGYNYGTYVNENPAIGSGILITNCGYYYFNGGSNWVAIDKPADFGDNSEYYHLISYVCADSDGSVYSYVSDGISLSGIYKLVSTAPADETPPVLTTSAADGTVTSSTYTFTVKAEDAVDGVVMPTVKLGGESGTALTGSAQGDGSYSYTAELAQGANTIYIEATDESGNKATATYTVTYVVAAQPDLTVTNISTPDNITAGTGVTVTATIENSGTANAGSFDVALYAGADPVETQNVASLAAGANIDVSFTWTPTAPGEVTLKTVADSGNTVTESNETNNELTKMVTVEGAQIEPDVNNDGQVNVLDMVLIGQKWGQTGSPGWIKEDVNQDGKIDVLDMILVGQHWTR